MKETPQPAPVKTSEGKHPKKLRPVYLTENRWADLKKTGNATHAINRILTEAGIAE